MDIVSITLSSFRSLALDDGHRVYHIVVTRFACISVSPQAVYYEH